MDAAFGPNFALALQLCAEISVDVGSGCEISADMTGWVDLTDSVVEVDLVSMWVQRRRAGCSVVLLGVAAVGNSVGPTVCMQTVAAGRNP